MSPGLTVGRLSQADLLIITGLHVVSSEQRSTTKSTSLCPQSLFCLSALIKAQVCCLLMFLQYTDSSSKAKTFQNSTEGAASLLHYGCTDFGQATL